MDKRKGQGSIMLHFFHRINLEIMNIQEDPSSNWPVGYTHEGVFIRFPDLSY